MAPTFSSTLMSPDSRDHTSPTTHSSPMRPLYTSCSEHFYAQADKEARENRFLCLNDLPRMPSPSPSPSPSTRRPQSSPFLRLPAELRLQIYSLLLLPRRATDLIPSYEKVHSSTQDYFDYDKRQHGTDRLQTADLARPQLLIRTVDPKRYESMSPHTRTPYTVRSDRFRARCMRTTYHCINVPRIEDQLAILRANKQIHAEAAELLYTTYTFDFDTHVEAIVPFLSDLTPFARSCIKSVRITKRALAYEKEFDRAEWSTALRYLTSASSGISLRRLQLGIVAGRPGPHGWDRISTYSAQDFNLLRGVEGMEWLQYILEIRGLDELDVSAVVEHCPPATNSMAMASYIRFSASVEHGFREFLRGQLVTAAA